MTFCTAFPLYVSQRSRSGIISAIERSFLKYESFELNALPNVNSPHSTCSYHLPSSTNASLTIALSMLLLNSVLNLLDRSLIHSLPPPSHSPLQPPAVS
jgi:hypothetical protein